MNNNESLTLFFNQVYHGPTFFNRSIKFGLGKKLPINPKFVQELVGEEVLSDEVIEKYNTGDRDEKRFAKQQIVSMLQLYLNTNYTPEIIGKVVSQYISWSVGLH